jgi:hypothetical protein
MICAPITMQSSAPGTPHDLAEHLRDFAERGIGTDGVGDDRYQIWPYLGSRHAALLVWPLSFD